MAHSTKISATSLPPVAPRRTGVPYNQRTSSADLNQNIRLANKLPIQTSEKVLNAAQPPVSMSRSFTFESGGVRRKIPVTPVVSTGPKRHDTLNYRQGTLLLPGVVGSLSLDLRATSKSNKATVDPSILKFCQKNDVTGLKNYISKRDGKIDAHTLNLTDSSGKSGLMLAAMDGHMLLLRELIHLQGIDLNICDNEGNTALHLAAQAGHADIVSLMAMCPSVLIDSRNHSGMTPLMKAALQGRIRCTRLLLLAGASPILRDFRRSMCALEWARYTGRTKCIEIIEKFIEKMQLNPGLGGPQPANRYTSEPNLKRSSLSGPSSKSKESWVKSTLKKAIQVVSGNKSSESSSPKFTVASQLTNSVLSASMSGSLPVLPSTARQASEMTANASAKQPTNPPATFVVPRIQVSFWNHSLGNIPPPPSAPAPKSLPQERNPAVNHRHIQHSTGEDASGEQPQVPTRSKSTKSRTMTSPLPVQDESSMVVKIFKYKQHD